MPRESHLSIRVSLEEKAALQKLADSQDMTLGKLARTMLRLRQESSTSRISEKTTRAAPVTSRKREIEWLEDNSGRLRLEYPGQWIIVEADQLVAHGDDYLVVLAEARRKGVQIPFVERIAEAGSAVWMGL